MLHMLFAYFFFVDRTLDLTIETDEIVDLTAVSDLSVIVSTVMTFLKSFPCKFFFFFFF